jgi:hypothetical protein
LMEQGTHGAAKLFINWIHDNKFIL